MNKIESILEQLIESAKAIGLHEEDVKSAEEFLKYNEYGLCFDTIIVQLYEYDIEIDNEFYEVVIKIANRMDLPPENFSFVKELIRDKNKVPIAVKLQLAKIVNMLMDQ